MRVIEDQLYRMDTIGFPNDLHATLYVSIIDYFYGRSFALPHPSGMQDAPPVFVEYEGGQKVRVFNGNGMRYKGALYVYFELDYPHTSEEREALLEEIVRKRQMRTTEPCCR